MASPPPLSEPMGTHLWLEWFRAVNTELGVYQGVVFWSNLDLTSSSLTDIASRNHNDLQSVDGGTSNEYYHLTQAQHDGLTDGGETSLHSHPVGTAVEFPDYTYATVPDATLYTSHMIYVSDGAAGSPTMAFSDGTNWLRTDTNTAISDS